MSFISSDINLERMRGAVIGPTTVPVLLLGNIEIGIYRYTVKYFFPVATSQNSSEDKTHSLRLYTQKTSDPLNYVPLAPEVINRDDMEGSSGTTVTVEGHFFMEEPGGEIVAADVESADTVEVFIQRLY